MAYDIIPLEAADAPRAVHVLNCEQSVPLEQRLSLSTNERPPLRAREVRIGMLAMTVNPADLLQMSGQYGVQLDPPYVPGHEGVAVVLETASGVTEVVPGDIVIPLAPGGTWLDERVIPARHTFVIKRQVDLFQCAMLSANPVTAWVLLNELVDLEHEACVVQNAANSAVGQCIRQLAAERGCRLINIVRRADAIDPHRQGDEHWLVDDNLTPDAFTAQIRQLTGQRPLRLAIDAVAGPSTRKLAAALSPGGTVVVYGLLSQQASALDPSDLIFRGITVQGFWLSSWFADAANRAKAKQILPELLERVAAGTLKMEVHATFDLQQVVQAIQHVEQPQRSGKVLLTGAWLQRLGMTAGKPQTQPPTNHLFV